MQAMKIPHRKIKNSNDEMPCASSIILQEGRGSHPLTQVACQGLETSTKEKNFSTLEKIQDRRKP
jgi:hypothetical protein